jgi:hypothetical protein
MRQLTKAASLPVIGIVLFQLGCQETSVGPVPPPKDLRKLSWRIDTLAYPGNFQTLMMSIWASSPRDVYVVGHSSSGPGSMYHFDGEQWRDVKIHPSVGGKIIGRLRAIYGFGRDNIYAVGGRIEYNPSPPPEYLDPSLAIHFDGREWRQLQVPEGRQLFSISGTSPNNIWTCGRDGTLIAFDGVRWRKESVSVPVPPGNTWFDLKDVQAKSPSEVYMIGYVHENNIARTTHYFFARQKDRWSVVDSFVLAPGQYESAFGSNGLWISPEGTLYSFGPHIFRRRGSSWEMIYETFDALRDMAGTSDTNMLAVGVFSKVLHYNGIDWHEFEELHLPNVSYSSVWTDGQEVFVVGSLNDGTKSIILHGK